MCLWFGPSPTGDHGDRGRAFDAGGSATFFDRDIDGRKLVPTMAGDW
jgi:hypothetical protein